MKPSKYVKNFIYDVIINLYDTYAECVPNYKAEDGAKLSTLRFVHMGAIVVKPPFTINIKL